MATVQVALAPSAQGRTPRATTSWAPPSGVIHTRPWRSSPLAGPAFSRLPTIISESSEESHEGDHSDDGSTRLRSRSPSWSSIDAASVSASASGYASGYGSRNTSLSALALFEGESSASSVSLFTSTSAHAGTSSSQSLGTRPARLTKSQWGRRNSLPPGEMPIVPPPQARIAHHERSRPLSFPALPVSSSIESMPRAYSRDSRFQSDHNTHKQPPSVSRDPDSNWMSSSPFGRGSTPKFSRLSMASPAVVMPLSAKEYRKRKSRDPHGKAKANENTSSSNHVTFSDSSKSAAIHGVPLVTVSPPPSEDTHHGRSSSLPYGDPRTTPQPHVGHAHPQPFPRPPQSHPQRRLTHKHKRPRSQPNTPPQSSPLGGQPPISPKSSSGTFVSFASTLDGDPTPQSMSVPTDDPNAINVVPPARPRPRLRRKSYPERVSNGARLSLLEAMDHLSQESTSLHRLSGMSQTDNLNRLSVASEGSGQTLFYDVAQSDGDGNEGQRMSGLRTKSLEDISSSLSVTVQRNGDGTTIKAKRNVRTVRISDTVQVSPAPVHRPRKLTKPRRGPVRGSASGPGAVKDTAAQTQTYERRASLLPWRSKVSGNNKSGAVVAVSVPTVSAPEKTSGDGDSPVPAEGSVYSNVNTSTSFPRLPSPYETGLARSHKISRSHSTQSSLEIPRPIPATTPDSEPESLSSMPHRKSRRYSFSFLPSSAFPRSKRENSDNAHPSLDNKSKESVGHVESGTDGTSTSIRTVTQGSQSTLIPASPELYNLTTLASSGRPSGSRRGMSSSAVPMLRRLNAQEEATPGAPLQSDSDDQCGSTPSLITTGSSATSSPPRTPSFPLVGGIGGEFVPRPSGLKESFTDASEEDSDDVIGQNRNSRICVHQRQKSPLARASLVITAEEEEWVHLNQTAGPNLSPSSYHGARPGTSTSSLTSATEQSESYVSFSTADPASTASSSSCSRSPSLLMGDTRDDEIYACALCGHLVPRGVQLSLPSSSTPEMHPMFTVPLLTVPASTVSLMETQPRFVGRLRHGSGRKSKGHSSLPSAGFPLSRQGRNHVDTTAHVNINGYLSESDTVMSTKTRTADNTMTTAPSTSPAKMRKRHRPQTAPAGTGEVALNFMEGVTALRAHEGSMDVHGSERQERSSKSKARGGESKFKTLLKELLRWRR